MASPAEHDCGCQNIILMQGTPALCGSAAMGWSLSPPEVVKAQR